MAFHSWGFTGNASYASLHFLAFASSIAATVEYCGAFLFFRRRWPFTFLVLRLGGIVQEMKSQLSRCSFTDFTTYSAPLRV